MKVYNLAKHFIYLNILAISFTSCLAKEIDEPIETVLQASTKATGSTNSNERLSLSPYPTGRKFLNSSDSEEKTEPEAEETEKTEETEEETMAEEKKEPPVYPISDFIFAEKNYGSQSPAPPSLPPNPDSVPPVHVDSLATGKLSVPPDIQTKPEEIAAETPVETEAEPVNQALQGEYERSVGVSSITRETFEEDKTAILGIIESLSTVMQKKDYKKWLTYVDDASIKYWSTKSNLQKAQNRLPVKGLTLKTLEDYFKYVFIPSRTGRTVDEIRYETARLVKAVHVNGDNDTVYYYFKKSAKGDWKIHLPPISD